MPTGRHWPHFLLIFAAFAVVGGCATVVPTLSDSKPIPKAQVFANAAQAPGAGTVTVLRDRALSGSALRYRLLIDGKLSAKIAIGEFVTFYLPPGEHLVELRNPIPRGGPFGDSLILQVTPGAEYFFRVVSDAEQMRLLRTTKDSVSPQPT